MHALLNVWDYSLYPGTGEVPEIQFEELKIIKEIISIFVHYTYVPTMLIF